MKLLPLTQNKFALVDDEDFERADCFKWSANFQHGSWYAVSSKEKRLHNFILPGHRQVDHKNNDGLDCQKHNLRPATNQQNSANRRKSCGRTSRYKGVVKRFNRWIAQIRVDGKQIYLGMFQDESEAARIYDVAAQKYFGEFARLNFN